MFKMIKHPSCPRKKLHSRARNWPRQIVWDNQQSGKDEFSLTELVLPDECPCLTIIRKDKWYFWEGLVNFLAGQVEFSSISSPVCQYFFASEKKLRSTFTSDYKLYQSVNHLSKILGTPLDKDNCSWVIINPCPAEFFVSIFHTF